jgi:predicted acylesterase/phospholipase RssA
MKLIKDAVFFSVALLVVTTLSGCISAHRGDPLPEALGDEAQIAGIPYARFWGDEPLPYEDKWLTASEEKLATYFSGIMNCEHTYLALSGGGPNGAFGAGLLGGWTAAGTRPEFTIVTGISTGALIAPFAFLGPKYDAQLKEIYSLYGTDDLVKKRSRLRFMARNASALNVDRLKALLAKYYDEDFVNEIAAETRTGRILLIGTMNLDAGRPVTWDIGRIANSDHPNRVELIQRIILASCSIPLAFPPVFFEVEANGQMYDEMHVDGGIANQVFLYSANMNWAGIMETLRIKGTPNVYVIRNASWDPEWKSVKPALMPIAGRSVNSLLRTQGIGDAYRIYLEAQRDGLNFNLASIPSDFSKESKEAFDPEMMKELYTLGYEMAKQGYEWQKTPPGFEDHGAR